MAITVTIFHKGLRILTGNRFSARAENTSEHGRFPENFAPYVREVTALAGVEERSKIYSISL